MSKSHSRSAATKPLAVVRKRPAVEMSSIPKEPSAPSERHRRRRPGAYERREWMSPETEIAVLADRFGRPEWRVEYSNDGACYVTIFAGLDAERRARDYHAALKSGTLKPIHPDR